MNNVNRRDFLKGIFATGVGAAALTTGASTLSASEIKAGSLGTVIDLTKCDGCPGSQVPSCVEACRIKNQDRFPQPEGEIHDYWPQKKHEDWSDKQHLTTRLTPYNWTAVQKVRVDDKEINIPRRCMHCDNPPCAKLCPFSAITKSDEGAVAINEDLCFGGAKCRDVCPWEIPQRQAGVGLYMQIAPQYVGGGVMYKCDLCQDLLSEGKEPACVSACPKGAMKVGSIEEMRNYAYEKATDLGGYVYGDKENGGTATFYISPVSFDKIDQALKSAEQKPTMPVEAKNFLDSANGMAQGFVIAPVAGAIAAGIAAFRSMKGDK